MATDTHAVLQDVISQEKGFDLEGRGWGDSSRVSKAEFVESLCEEYVFIIFMLFFFYPVFVSHALNAAFSHLCLSSPW